MRGDFSHISDKGHACLALFAFKGRGHKTLEEWVRGSRSALEFRMKLASDEEGMSRQLHHFDKAVFIIHGGYDQPCIFACFAVIGIELVTVAVASNRYPS